MGRYVVCVERPHLGLVVVVIQLLSKWFREALCTTRIRELIGEDEWLEEGISREKLNTWGARGRDP